MVYKNILQVLEKEHEVFGRLKKSVENISADRLEIKADDDGWAIKQIFEHLAIVEEQILRLIFHLLDKTEKNKSETDKIDTEISITALLEQTKDTKYKTREQYEPLSNDALEKSLQKLEDVHKKLNSLSQRLSAVNLSDMSFPHWTLGNLTLGQWIAFLVYHEERHLNQVASILELSAAG